MKTIISTVLLSLLLPISANNEATAEKLKYQQRNIYLVRHAEKILDGTDDPSLTVAGIKRSQWLSKQLLTADITAIYSTNYIRTLATAKPLATQLGIKIKLYQPSELEQLAVLLKSEKGNTLVVGHSNTTLTLIFLLAGKHFEPMDESEYNHLYLISYKQAEVTSELLEIYAQ